MPKSSAHCCRSHTMTLKQVTYYYYAIALMKIIPFLIFQISVIEKSSSVDSIKRIESNRCSAFLIRLTRLLLYKREGWQFSYTAIEAHYRPIYYDCRSTVFVDKDAQIQNIRNITIDFKIITTCK